MVQNRSLSAFWREDVSDDRVMELTSVLQGADALIGVMGSGVQAVWSTNGASQTWWYQTAAGKAIEMRVFLDYAPLAVLRAPFDGRAVDEVVGYAAHEGGHCLWSSGTAKADVQGILRLQRDAKLAAKQTDAPAIEEILRVANILEDAFIDYHVAKQWPVLGEYIRVARKGIADRRPIDYSAIAQRSRPPYNFIVNLWIAVSLYDYDIPKQMSANVSRAMNYLIAKTLEAVQNDSAKSRLVLAVECWWYLTREFPKTSDDLPKASKPQEQTRRPSETEEEEKEEGGEGQEGTGQDENESGEGAGESGDDEKTENEQGEQGKGSGDEEESVGESAGEAEDGTGSGEPEKGQEFGPAGEEGEESGAGEADKDLGIEDPDNKPTEQKGGDSGGKLGNLDDFDIRSIKEMPEKLLEEVMAAIAHEIEDLSKSVAEVFTGDARRILAATRKADWDEQAARKIISSVESEIQEMRRVFDRQAAIQSRTIKGKTHGKLDGRSLSRIATGNLKVFKSREILERPDLDIGLLLDVSGSMGMYMNIVYQTGAIFAEALIRKQGVNFLCLTYTGGFLDCQTNRIVDREMGRLCLGNVQCGGGTPSGPAIASMMVLMKRMPERQKIIIHFTDGAPDSADAVRVAVEAARKQGFTVWGVSLSGYQSMLASQYGEGNYQTIGSVSELPRKIADLVKQLTAR